MDILYRREKAGELALASLLYLIYKKYRADGSPRGDVTTTFSDMDEEVQSEFYFRQKSC